MPDRPNLSSLICAMGITIDQPHRAVVGRPYAQPGGSGLQLSLLLGLLFLPCVKCLLLSRISGFLGGSFDRCQEKPQLLLWAGVKLFSMAAGNPFVQREKGAVSASQDSWDIKWGVDFEVQRSVFLSWICPLALGALGQVTS